MLPHTVSAPQGSRTVAGGTPRALFPADFGRRMRGRGSNRPSRCAGCSGEPLRPAYRFTQGRGGPDSADARHRARFGVFDSRDPLANLRGKARYLRSHLDEFKRFDLALAAYNAGPGRVRMLGRIPPFRETIGYVAAITKGWGNGVKKAVSVQTASSPAIPAIGRGRGVELLAYTSTRVANPR